MPSAKRGAASLRKRRRRQMPDEDEEIVSSDDEDQLPVSGVEDDEDPDANGAGELEDDRRVRMARNMLANIAEAKRAAGVDDEDVDDLVGRELEKQAAVARGRHFVRIAHHLRECDSTGLTVRCIKGHRRPTTCMAVSGDDRLAYTASKDGELVRYDLEHATRERITPKRGPRAHVSSMALSADGTILACGGADQLLHVWDTRLKSVKESFKVRQQQPQRQPRQKRWRFY